MLFLYRFTSFYNFFGRFLGFKKYKVFLFF
nr:MAG TPA_asm: hypothetical protein [Caudoviricetes sp.]